jgi:hypothetical protein
MGKIVTQKSKFFLYIFCFSSSKINPYMTESIIKLFRSRTYTLETIHQQNIYYMIYEYIN